MHLRDFQKQIHDTFHHLDANRGIAGNFLWFSEEVGELAEAIRRRHELTPTMVKDEFADVLAWLMSLANLSGVDMEDAILKYKHGCPRCRKSPCRCPHPEQTAPGRPS